MEMEEEIERKEASQSLPEALVEKIIAMMPFPSIFKARALSKSWRDKFSPISSSSSSGADKSLAAAAFQRQVGEWSSNWKTFSPVLAVKEDLVYYDRAARNWPRQPSMLSFLQDRAGLLLVPRLIEGALFYGFAGRGASNYDMEDVFVANILTRSWRLLPPRPNARATPVLVLKLVVHPSLNMYKVILFCKQEGHPDHYCAQIYESKSGAWRSENFMVSSDFTDGPAAVAYLNGVLYMVGVTTPQSLLAFNVEEETLEELRLSFDDSEPLKTASLNLVICNVNWLMIATKGWWHEGLYQDTIQVFRIDLGSQRLLRLAHGPPASLNMGSMPFFSPCGDGNCIFFCKIEEHGCQVVAYNVDEDVWSSFPVPVPVDSNGRIYPWCESSFQPGLSTFVAV